MGGLKWFIANLTLFIDVAGWVFEVANHKFVKIAEAYHYLIEVDTIGLVCSGCGKLFRFTKKFLMARHTLDTHPCPRSPEAYANCERFSDHIYWAFVFMVTRQRDDTATGHLERSLMMAQKWYMAEGAPLPSAEFAEFFLE